MSECGPGPSGKTRDDLARRRWARLAKPRPARPALRRRRGLAPPPRSRSRTSRPDGPERGCRSTTMSAAPGADTDEFPAADELLGKHFGPSPPPVHVTFGALSHPGLVRPNNEDHYLVIERRRTRSVLLTNLPAAALRPGDDIGYVLAVADGIG